MSQTYWINKVCPMCGDGDLDVTKTHMTLCLYYEHCIAKNDDIDYDMDSLPEYFDSDDTIVICECSACGHKYTNTCVSDVILHEMITEEAFKEKKAAEIASFEGCENCTHWKDTKTLGEIMIKSCRNKLNLPDEKSILLTQHNSWCMYWEKK